MHDGAYRKRLEADLPRWREQGWVTESGQAGILAALPEQRAAFGFAAILGTLGALLLGSGVVLFVGSNWEEIPRIVRFGLLVAAMAVAYGAAAFFARPGLGLRVFSEAALLVAGLVFAAAIALVGQTYHLSGDFAGAILLWEIGILIAAFLTLSPTMTVLALAGSAYWAWIIVFERELAPHWGSLVTILIGAALAAWLNVAYVRFLAVIALGYWIVLNVIGIAGPLDWSLAAGMAVMAVAALLFWAIGSGLASYKPWPRAAAFGEAMLWPGLAGTLAALGILQTAAQWWGSPQDDPQWLTLAAAGVAGILVFSAIALVQKGISIIDLVGAVIIGGAAIAFANWVFEDTIGTRLAGGLLVLGAAIFVVNIGQTSPQRIGKKLGLAAFGIEIIYLYIVTLGTMIDTAAAFLLGGVLFIALSYALIKVDRHLTKAKAGAAS